MGDSTSGSTVNPMTFPISVSVSIPSPDSHQASSPSSPSSPSSSQDHFMSHGTRNTSFSSMSSNSFNVTPPIFCCGYLPAHSRKGSGTSHLRWLKSRWRAVKKALKRLVSGPKPTFVEVVTEAPMHACGSPDPLMSVTLTTPTEPKSDSSPQVAFSDRGSVHSWTSQSSIGPRRHYYCPW
ncbi:hypothetical protein B484DRAFT_406317 [Ochromonadaceae sp. CCMP2298]|nr:hypothetical protein B484DRAFT_406317 [Ochromonadaceae sp. CCMP2298]